MEIEYDAAKAESNYRKYRIHFEDAAGALTDQNGLTASDTISDPSGRAQCVRQEGRSISILASRNVDGLMEQARAIPGASVEQYPVGLKEIFLEQVRVQ